MVTGTFSDGFNRGAVAQITELLSTQQRRKWLENSVQTGERRRKQVTLRWPRIC